MAGKNLEEESKVFGSDIIQRPASIKNEEQEISSASVV
jgi:hypothetical protein